MGNSDYIKGFMEIEKFKALKLSRIYEEEYSRGEKGNLSEKQIKMNIEARKKELEKTIGKMYDEANEV